MKTDRIIIVGGGSAGWMTAATLSHQFPKKQITLIESPNAPIIGVGESTIGKINNWLSLLQIKDTDFMKHTDASYKLSIRFEDFYKKGAGAFHYPFQLPKTDNTANGLNDWVLRKDALNGQLDVSDYADSYCSVMGLVNNNTFTKDGIPDFMFNRDCAYHFDAIKFGQYLKNHRCKNVKHIVEDITEIETDERGIKNLNGKYMADLFIDCTGFKRLLIKETLKEEFISYEDILPNNRALATHIEYGYGEVEKQLKPYTNCTAIENGWVWNIPLWSRIGTGYVYSSKFVDDETALKQFKKHLKRKDLEFKKIKMRVGLHNRLWVKNVVAIGLSAGFIEPLESNGLFSVHEFLLKLVRNLQREKISQWDRDNFNYACKGIFKTFAEFVAMHYALSHRNDTEYWKSCMNKTWSEDLITLKQSHIFGFQKAAQDRNLNYHHNLDGGLHCIAAGMNWSPTDKSSLIIHKQWNEGVMKEVANNLDLRTKEIIRKVKNEYNLYDYLKEKIYK